MPAMARGLAAGAPVTIDAEATIADGIAVRRAGEITLPVIRALADDVVAVDEEDIARAILALLEVEKTVVEGAGAVPLAALLAGRLSLAGRAVVLVLSGGNIDVNLVARIIERGLVRDGRVVRLAVLVRDRPGGLARLTGLVAEARANVLHIRHDRAAAHAPVGESEVELTLETAGPEHIAEVVRRLTAAGYTVDAGSSSPAP
jgi:threonine dehydratase